MSTRSIDQEETESKVIHTTEESLINIKTGVELNSLHRMESASKQNGKENPVIRRLVYNEHVVKNLLKSVKKSMSELHLECMASKLEKARQSYLDVILTNVEFYIFKWKLDARAWHLIFYPCITVFRANSNHRLCERIVQLYNKVLDDVYAFYASILTIVKSNSQNDLDRFLLSIGQWMIKLGDICRYRMDISDHNKPHKCGSHCNEDLLEEIIQSQKTPHIPQFQDKENMLPCCLLSKYFYHQASLLICESEKPFYKLAILSIKREENVLKTLYYLYESIRLSKIVRVNAESQKKCGDSELTARSILESIFTRNNKALLRNSCVYEYSNNEQKRPSTNIGEYGRVFTMNMVKCHWCLNSGIDLDLVASLCQELQKLQNKFDCKSILSDCLRISSPEYFSKRSEPYLYILNRCLDEIVVNKITSPVEDTLVESDACDAATLDDNLCLQFAKIGTTQITNSVRYELNAIPSMLYSNEFDIADKINNSRIKESGWEHTFSNCNFENEIFEPIQLENKIDEANEPYKLSTTEKEEIDDETLKLILQRNKLRDEIEKKSVSSVIRQLSDKPNLINIIDFGLKILAVFDTNTLMGNLALANIICKYCTVMIPQAVKTELMNLLERRSMCDDFSKRSQCGLAWLSSHSYEIVTNYNEGQSNDDKILEASINLKQSNPEEQVVLVTGDKILSIKAYQKHIHSMSPLYLVADLRRYYMNRGI
ncbi:hypothetical protein GJ496_011759 [Pomphorhynchus laevis]|nr:hypothetical protein GJ496_011756 [Pomphorhynchus laevis]KAI0982452.1 hypothetical protein GJ496_011757 [Pomphorhynchus laevis]KAI0982453.1 hypothetical protein GJ496_011758 [Pomphorhynchus laevis]KAI0982454.1 hypothetical protein GJ496_011759 [Pomphorhynchus laevis]